MILQRVENPDFLSNAYLVVDEPGGHGVLIDSNGEHVTEPLVERVEREGTEITHVLLTHHHWDHVLDVEKLAERFGAPVLAHPKAAELLEGKVTETMDEGDAIESGRLRIEVLHTPGHCADHLALVVDGTDCLTADVIFKGTVGGTRAPGATGFEDLKGSIMDKLMKLPPETRIHPGHRGPSTIGEEWERNPFIRVWRGLDEEGSEPVSIGPADAEERDEADPGSVGAGLRRRQQGLGATGRRLRRDRRRLAGEARGLTGNDRLERRCAKLIYAAIASLDGSTPVLEARAGQVRLGDARDEARRTLLRPAGLEAADRHLPIRAPDVRDRWCSGRPRSRRGRSSRQCSGTMPRSGGAAAKIAYSGASVGIQRRGHGSSASSIQIAVRRLKQSSAASTSQSRVPSSPPGNRRGAG